MALPPEMMKDAPPPVGVMETCEPGIRRILAPNPPSPMTYWGGTNTYVVGEGRVAVIDPGGPADPAHMQAILEG